MTDNQTHEWVFARNLEKGDQVEVVGQECTIAKKEDIFHYVPNARVRLVLQVDGLPDKKVKSQMILALPEEMTVKRKLK